MNDKIIDWTKADPMFDGHPEKPIEQMTPAERLRWAWEGTLLLHWARQVRIKNGLDPDPLGEDAQSPVD